jgi:hypothetical protein
MYSAIPIEARWLVILAEMTPPVYTDTAKGCQYISGGLAPSHDLWIFEQDFTARIEISHIQLRNPSIAPTYVTKVIILLQFVGVGIRPHIFSLFYPAEETDRTQIGML